MPTTGVVLAGGQGRRMGRDKGALRLEGVSLAERAAGVLRELCPTVVISVAPGAPNPAPGFPFVADRPPGFRGPLAGIDAAFAQVAGGDDLLVLACDYPAVEASLLERVLSRSDADAEIVFPTGHPLVGLWRRRVERSVRRALAGRRFRVGDLVDRCRARRLSAADLAGIDWERMLHNVNRPDDLRRSGGQRPEQGS